MIGQLVQVCCPSGSSPELIDSVENSSREVVALRAEVERLQRENLELRQQVGYWQSRHRDTPSRWGPRADASRWGQTEFLVN